MRIRLRKKSRRRLVLALAALLFGSAAIVGSVALMKWRTHRRYLWMRAGGTQALAAGDFALARRLLQDYLRYRPNDAAAQYRFALADHRLEGPGRRFEADAIVALTRVVDAQPSHLGANQLLLTYCRRLGMLDEALTIADRLLAGQPDHVQTLRARCDLFRRLGRWREALTDAERLVELRPGEITAQDMMLRAAKDGGLLCELAAPFPRDSAKYALLRAIEADGADAAYWLKQAAAAPMPNDPPAVLMLVRRLDDAGLYDTAEQVLNRAVARLPDVRIDRAWLRRQVEQGRYQAVIDRIGHLDPARDALDSESLAWLAWSCRRVGQSDRVATCRAALRGRTYDVIAQAWVLVLSDSPSIDDLNDAIAIDPDQAIFHVLLGERWSQLDEWPLAAASFERAVEKSPAWAAPRRLLGALPADRFAAGFSQDAESLREATAGLGVVWRIILADRLIRNQADSASLQRAAELLHQTIRLCPREPVPHEMLARCLRAIGSNQQAAQREQLAAVLRRP